MDLATLPEAVNLWRHELRWIGGLGALVLAVAILPLLGVGGIQVYKAETPGPMKDARLAVRIAATAKRLGSLYAGMTLACLLCLRLAGMSWFDAVCHAFAALALGLSLERSSGAVAGRTTRRRRALAMADDANVAAKLLAAVA